MKNNKFEISLFVALGVMLLCVLLQPAGITAWWAVAFESLCDGVLTEDTLGEGIVLQSRLLLWLQSLRG